jgi:hypothetical protein
MLTDTLGRENGWLWITGPPVDNEPVSNLLSGSKAM